MLSWRQNAPATKQKHMYWKGLKGHASLPTSCFYFGSLSSSFSRAIHFDLQIAEGYQRLKMKLKLWLVRPGRFLLLRTWSSREHKPLPCVICLVGQVCQPSSGSTRPWRMCILSAAASQLQVCNATQCSAGHTSHNSKNGTIFSWKVGKVA